MLSNLTTPVAAACPQSDPFAAAPSTHATGPWQAPAFGAYGPFATRGVVGSGIEGVAGRVSAMRDRLVVDRIDASATKHGRPPRGELR